MDVGTGIVVATLVAVAAWQIDKRGAWRKVGRAALFMIALVAVAGLAAWGYVRYADAKYARMQQEMQSSVVQRIQSSEPAVIRGVRLGMPFDEVQYAWGKPNGSSESAYLWKDDSGDFKAVGVDGDGKVEFVACLAASVLSVHGLCAPYVGLEAFDSEDRVRALLGAPEAQPRYVGARKILTYGKSGAFLDVVLEQQRVVGFVIYKEPGRFAITYDGETGSAQP